jgi:hypothetical protein
MPRPPKYAKSVDANQKEIVRLLNEIPGMKAVVIGDKKDYEHRYTQKQREFLKTWPGQVRVAKSFEEVLNVLMDSYT